MTGRTLDATTATAIVAGTVYPAWFMRADVASEPIYIHTMMGDITFPGTGYDAPLCGLTFLGKGQIFQIDGITDDSQGSQSMKVTIPGVDPADHYLKEFVTNADQWQKRAFYLWLATFDETGAMLGKPFRVKTGRMDQLEMMFDAGGNKGTLSVSIESQQAYSAAPLNSRYITQNQIDSTDTSQNYVLDLANKSAEIGNPSSGVSGAGFAGGGFGAGGFIYGDGYYQRQLA